MEHIDHSVDYTTIQLPTTAPMEHIDHSVARNGILLLVAHNICPITEIILMTPLIAQSV